MSGPAAIHILHVDDDPAFASLTADMLENEDERLTVETAQSATEGLDRLAEDGIDCIVSDYNMPGMDGIEFLETVREEYPNLPFILFTGKGSETVASEAISTGVTDYLQKAAGTERYELLANRIDNAVELTRAQRERQRHLDAIETAREGISIFNDDGEFVYVNEAYADLYGYDPEEMIGERWELIYREEDISDVHDEILPTVEADGYWRGETVGLRADGSTFVEDHTLASTDEGELICTVQDITEHKDRKQELKRKERRYQAIFNDPNVLAVILDKDGTLIEVNQQALDYIDATEEEVRGELIWETPWWDAETRQAVRQKVEQAASGEYTNYEADLTKPDSEPYNVAGHIRPVTDDSGNVTSLIISARDITERKKRERELERYEAYLEGSSDIITVLDDSGTITYQSPAVERILGYDAGELVGANGFDLMHPDDLDEAYEVFTDLIAEPGATVTIEARFNTADDEWRWLEVRGTNRLEDDSIEGVVTNNRDITEQKERERRYDAVFNNTYQFTGLMEPDGTLIEANETALEFGGLEREDVIGTKMWEAYWFQHSEDTRDRAHRAVERAADGEFVRHELTVQGADREAIIDFSVRPVTDEQGNVTLLIPEGRDITERKDQENRLRDLNERTHNLVAADTREQISELSVKTASEVLGLDANAIHLYDDEQAGLVPVAGTDDIHDLVGDLPVFTAGDSIAWRVYDNGETLALDDVHDDPDLYNPETPIRSELYIPLGDHGILIAGSETPAAFDQQDVVFGEILADIIIAALNRVNREQALKQSEARYRSLTDDVLDTSAVGTFILDADFEIVWINEATEEYFGIDRDAVVGADKRQLIHDHVKHSVEDSEEFATTVLATYDDNTYVEEFDCHVLPADGRDERWLKHWSQPIESGLYEGGRIEHYTDITERKRREQELTRQNERLDQFASVVSHDLRNPLRVAKGQLELARDECDSERLDDIGHAHERMDALIDDLLTLAREGDPVDTTDSIDLASLTQNCWRNVATAEATLTTDVERTINADQSRLQQLLENLLRNAIEHGGEDVSVTIGDSEDGFYVEDDGPGISEDERDKVFEAGYSTAAEGTGFGLNIVKQVAQAHDWTVRVTDGSDGGARFEITGVEFTAE